MVENGKQRVIITNVSPQIDGGAYPAKGAVAEAIEITADIFSDGHDEIAASVFIRSDTSEKWKEIPMKFVINDHWKASFLPARNRLLSLPDRSMGGSFHHLEKRIREKSRRRAGPNC